VTDRKRGFESCWGRHFDCVEVFRSVF